MILINHAYMHMHVCIHLQRTAECIDDLHHNLSSAVCSLHPNHQPPSYLTYLTYLTYTLLDLGADRRQANGIPPPNPYAIPCLFIKCMDWDKLRAKPFPTFHFFFFSFSLHLPYCRLPICQLLRTP